MGFPAQIIHHLIAYQLVTSPYLAWVVHRQLTQSDAKSILEKSFQLGEVFWNFSSIGRVFKNSGINSKLKWDISAGLSSSRPHSELKVQPKVYTGSHKKIRKEQN